MINHLGKEGINHLLHIYNKSYQKGKLPDAWKQAQIIPIPKHNNPKAYRPISLLSCLGKTLERIVLSRLQFKIPDLHHNLFALKKKKNTRTANDTAALRSVLDEGKATLILLDLEKAFELADPTTITYIFAEKGIKGQLLVRIVNYLTDRKATVKFQGHISQSRTFEKGTPPGGPDSLQPVD